MDINRTEEEQLEAIKQWWSENGVSVVGGIAIGIAAIFGWRGWQAHELARASAASDLYSKMVVDVRQNKAADARTSATRLLDEYKSTSYGVYAALTLAKLDAESGDLAGAAKQLQWALDNSKETPFQHLARLRLARVLLDDGKLDQALALLNGVAAGEFSASYSELKGDIYLQQGNQAQALTAYQEAIAGLAPSATGDSFLQMKIDNLGRKPE